MEIERLAFGLARYRRMLSNSSGKMQAVIDRYGELLFRRIDRLPDCEMFAVWAKSSEMMGSGANG